MNQPTHLKRGRTVRETVERETRGVVSRMGAGDPEAFVRERFLRRFWDDYPHDLRAVEIADAFDGAVKKSRGNVARFRQILERELEPLL